MKLAPVLRIHIVLLLIPLITSRDLYCLLPDDVLPTSYFKCFRDQGNSQVLLGFSSLSKGINEF